MAFHQYNTFQYNTSQYNADTTFYVLNCIEAIASVDTESEYFSKVLSDSSTLTDVLAKESAMYLTDPISMSDVLTKQITDKRFLETIRLQAWLSIKKTGSHWSN
jgi:hypothetical protein